MGFSTLFDIVGSILVGGIILVMIGRINSNAMENTITSNTEFQTQSSMTSVVSAIESDLRKIGYTANYITPGNPEDAILLADTSSIKYLYDYDKNGAYDTIYYYLGPTSDLSGTPNPYDRYIYKKINNSAPVKVTSGVTTFKLTYFKFENNQSIKMTFPITGASLKNINSLELMIALAPGRAVPNERDPYPTSYWRQSKVTTRNLFSR